jgi:hypothetical protein
MAMQQFVGFPKDAFSIYTKEKWSSMVHNLPRMRNKDLLQQLCRQASAPLAEALAGLDCAASDEIPNIANQKKVETQSVYWFRDAAARASLTTFLGKTPLDQSVIFNIAPQDKHATLTVRMSVDELWIGLRVASGATVDRRNLKQKGEQSWERSRLVELLHGLPSGAKVGFAGRSLECGECSPEQLQELTDALQDAPEAFLVGIGMPQADAVAEAADLVDFVQHWLDALLPVYRFVAWTRDNDLIDASKQIQEDKAQKRRQATAFVKGDRVRVTTGLFASKFGVVQETDTKGQVKVLVGKMSVVLAGSDVTPVHKT